MPDNLVSLLDTKIVQDPNSPEIKEKDIYMDALIHLRREDYLPGMALLEQIPEGNYYYHNAQNLLEQIEKYVAGKFEKKIRELIKKIQTAYDGRDFDLATDLLRSAREYQMRLPGSAKLNWDVDLKILNDRIRVGIEMESKYSRAKIYLQEASDSKYIGGLPTAMRLLDEVIGYTGSDKAIDYFRGEAEKARRQVFLRGIMEDPCDLTDVTQKLLLHMRDNLEDQTLLRQYARYKAIQFFHNALQQSQTMPRKMEERDEKIVNELMKNNEEMRHEAQRWHWASLLATIISICIFLYGIIIIFQRREALDYLTPLYGLMTSMLTALFFSRYDNANKRNDARIEDMLKQIAEHDKLAFKEYKGLERQVRRDLEITDTTSEQILAESEKKE